MEFVVEAVALIVWVDDLESGSGWYVRDGEVPWSGQAGPFATKAAAEAFALGCGYTEVR